MDEDGSSSSTALLKRDEQSNNLKRQLLGLGGPPDIKGELPANKAAGSPPTGAGPSPSPPTGAGPSTGTSPVSPLPSTPSQTPLPSTTSNTTIPPGPDSHPFNDSSLAPFGPTINNNGSNAPTISPNSSIPNAGGNTTSPTDSHNSTRPNTTSELPTSRANTTAPVFYRPPARHNDTGIATTTVKTMVLVLCGGNSNRVGSLNKDWKIMMKTYLILVLLVTFAEKRYDAHFRPSSINSASSPSSMNRRGNGQHLGDGNYPGPNTSVSGYSQPGPRIGEFYSHPYETHNVDQDPSSHNLSLSYPPKRGYTLEMEPLETAHTGPKDEEPTIPRPVFESNIHRLSDLSLGAKFASQ
ncbi:hypothetical protein DFH28DRAFT_1093779 [Melampsora americana]|nr:hypothetical protein DFH28DRAFT_1093779 [Melampsora americana]